MMTCKQSSYYCAFVRFFAGFPFYARNSEYA